MANRLPVMKLVTIFLLSPVLLLPQCLLAAAGNSVLANEDSGRVQQAPRASRSAASTDATPGSVKPKDTQSSNTVRPLPAPPNVYLKKIIVLSPAKAGSPAPDASEIVSLMGQPAPFSLMARGQDSVLIYVSKLKLTKQEGDLLEELQAQIAQLAGNQGTSKEIRIAHACKAPL